jgi:hypothetical protein
MCLGVLLPLTVSCFDSNGRHGSSIYPEVMTAKLRFCYRIRRDMARTSAVIVR